MSVTVRIATRSSRLALWQANYVARELQNCNSGLSVELIEVSTSGDREQTEPLRTFGGLGVFTREVQKAVLDGRADIAVHSLKDLPTEQVEGLQLACVPERASKFDALVLPKSSTTKAIALTDLPDDMRIGTGSPRRQAQLKYVNSSVQLLEIRGNVETRLRKLDEGEFDALILAEAGLNRLELSDRISLRLTPPEMFPAVGQGALGIECRTDDESTAAALATINHSTTNAATIAERALLRSLRAGCHAPVGVDASIKNGRITLSAVLLDSEGTIRLHHQDDDDASEANELGCRVARKLLDGGGEQLIHPDGT